MSENWDEFARNNDGISVLSQNVIGKSIKEFISGDPSIMWMDAILMSAKIKGKPIEKNYRCDSPDMKRYMKMIIQPLDNGCLKLTHYVIKTEKQKQRIIYKGSKILTPNTMQRCSVCGRILYENSWYEINEYAEIKPKNISEFKVIYSVCDGCKRNLPGI